MGYHVLVDGEQTGPFEIEALAEMIARGEVTATTMVWSPDMAEWAAAGSVAALSGLLVGSAASTVGGGRLRVFDAIATGFRALMAQKLRTLLIGVALIGLAFATALPILAAMIPYWDAMMGGTGTVEPSAYAIVIVVAGIATAVLALALAGGTCAVMLDAVRGQQMRVGRLLSGLSRIIPLLVATIVFAVIMAIGLAIVGGIVYAAELEILVILALPLYVLYLVYYLAMFHVMDAGAGGYAALGDAKRMIDGLGWWRMIGAALLVILIFIVITLVIMLVAGLLMLAAPGLAPDTMIEQSPWALSIGMAIAMVVRIVVTVILSMFVIAVFAAIYEQGRGRTGVST
jgi:hypothetical protein